MNPYLEELTASLEAIEFKRDPLLFNELVTILSAYRGGNASVNELATAIAKSIKTHTNMAVRFNILKGKTGAYASPPRIDPNSPLLINIKAITRDENADRLSMHGFQVFKNKLDNVGWVNRECGTVHGVFSVMVSDIYISQNVLTSSMFTAEEVTALVLHELGHIFTVYETLGSTISTNYALATIADGIINTSDTNRKVEIIRTAQRFIDFKDLDTSAITGAKKGEVVVSLLYDAKIKSIRSQTGLTAYDKTGWEFLSDQYATRQGAGRHLVTALDKISRSVGDSDYLGGVGRFFTYVLHYVLSCIGSTLTGGLVAYYLLLAGFWVSPTDMGEYDKTTDRFKRVRNDMVNALKTDGLDKVAKESIVDDIQTIDNITAKMKPFYGLWECFYMFVHPRNRRMERQKVLEQELELLATNDLYVKSAQFSNLL